MEMKAENNFQCEDDVILIECGNEIPKPISETKPTTHRKPSRTVSLDIRENNSETLIITQKVKLHTHKIKYIINLNTNVSDSNVKKDEESPKLLSSKIERSVPKCSRRKCQYILKLHKQTLSSSRGHTSKVSKPRTHNTKTKYRERHKHTEKDRGHKHSRIKENNLDLDTKPCVKKKLMKEEQSVTTHDNLSSLSLSPISYSNISYENISSDSFSDTDLDTLIKRSKERDKLNSQPAQSSGSFSDIMCCSNSPQSIIEISSDSDTDMFVEEVMLEKKILVLRPTCDLKTQADTSVLCPIENICSESMKFEELKNETSC